MIRASHFLSGFSLSFFSSSSLSSTFLDISSSAPSAIKISVKLFFILKQRYVTEKVTYILDNLFISFLFTLYIKVPKYLIFFLIQEAILFLFSKSLLSLQPLHTFVHSIHFILHLKENQNIQRSKELYHISQLIMKKKKIIIIPSTPQVTELRLKLDSQQSIPVYTAWGQSLKTFHTGEKKNCSSKLLQAIRFIWKKVIHTISIKLMMTWVPCGLSIQRRFCKWLNFFFSSAGLFPL